mmetsp:Transcript_29014/g.37454  ORF Transcript_29014/g.37454 Transcript_29014/m.37454 type:complete len:420 (-) Transcript_29014:135-1394(-)
MSLIHQSMDILSLINLPTEVLSVVYEYVLLTDLFELEQVQHSEINKFLASTASSNVWKSAVGAMWSPEVALGNFKSWREAAHHVERVAFPILQTKGMKSSLRSLEFYQMIPPMMGRNPWATTFNMDIIKSNLKYRKDIHSRRQVTLFACSSSFAGASPIVNTTASSSSTRTPTPSTPPLLTNVNSDDVSDEISSDDEDEAKNVNIMHVISMFDVIKKAKNPEEALRLLLLEFPFLPIDAGEGADRVIYALARIYIESHPNELLSLRNDKERKGSTHDNAESAIYILLYSIIMLNTDRHHPAIRSKMKLNEFISSTKSTVVREAFSDEVLIDIFNSISQNPLKIVTSLNTQKKLKNLLDEETRKKDFHYLSRLHEQSSCNSPWSSLSKMWSNSFRDNEYRSWVVPAVTTTAICLMISSAC